MALTNSLMTGMGISLGNLNLIEDFLNNPEYFEPELTEIKTTISNKPLGQINKLQKPIRPRITKENIISKFSIIKYTIKLESDEIMDSSTEINDDSNFDSSFEELEQEQLQEIENDEDAMNANMIAQLLSGDSYMTTQDNNKNYEDIELDEDMEFNIDESELGFEEQNNNESDTEEFEFEVEEDDEDNEDEFEFDIDESELGFEDEEETSEESELDIDNLELELEDDEDNEDDFEFDVDESELGFEEETEENLDNEIDNIEFDIEDSFENEDESDEEVINKTNRVQYNVQSDNIPSKQLNNNSIKELEDMKKKLADMEKQMQDMKKESAKKEASNLSGEIKNDKSNEIEKPIEPKVSVNKYEEYNGMTIEQLYKVVRNYMYTLGVKTKPIDLKILYQQFGEINIKKLIKKSYLIRVGQGVTTGR